MALLFGKLTLCESIPGLATRTVASVPLVV